MEPLIRNKLRDYMGPFTAMSKGLQTIWAMMFVSLQKQQPSPVDLYFIALREGILWHKKHPLTAEAALDEMVKFDMDEITQLTEESTDVYDMVMLSDGGQAEDSHLEGQFEDSVNGGNDDITVDDV